MRVVNKSFKLVEGYVSPQGQNSDEHEMSKFLICLDLTRQKKSFYTEVRLVGGGIADILVPEDMTVIEVLHSEKLSDCKEKVKKYPSILNIVYANSEDILRGEHIV